MSAPVTPGSGHVVLVEEDPAASKAMCRCLEEAGFRVTTVDEASRVLRDIDELSPDVIVTSYDLPGYLNGLELLRYVNRRYPGLPVLLVSSHGNEKTAVEAMQIGAFSYLPRPLDYCELVGEVHRAAGTAAGAGRRTLAPAQHGLVGQSAPMVEVRRLIEDVAGTRATVLILGETGTGKEVVARAIHRLSPRREGPFVPVNCAAIPDTLLEAELFGYVRGAFTGAEQNRDGKLLSADRGTLFLDEIGEMPLVIQPKLLRFLEEGVVTPLGSDECRSVDLRFIAATHRDLRQEVDAGRFREDLYYRLNVVPIRLPPLRERKEDIPLLVAHFLPALARRHGRTVRRVDPEVTRWLESPALAGQRPGTGERARARLVVFCRDGILRLAPDQVPDRLIMPYHDEKRRVLDAFEREYLANALLATRGRVGEIARASGLSPRQVYNSAAQAPAEGRGHAPSRGRRR
ncbi:MAG: sigma-54 dependent transcriptional regulator [Acidobacteriota bacterium]|nr:sigma-54 dependent transcriptional regulator [Acidobacteriota bacterium]